MRIEIADNNRLGLTNKTLRARTFQPLLGQLVIQGNVSAGISLKAEAEIGPIVIRYWPPPSQRVSCQVIGGVA